MFQKSIRLETAAASMVGRGGTGGASFQAVNVSIKPKAATPAIKRPARNQTARTGHAANNSGQGAM